ncbi:uncharacterized protein LTR77_000381 [Saxophila tyrrhenica]|uniref:F-box domain-containing protein n=1 Tax=Saxophila tyrrhenica TaxID=1690608 RepID=A0AAV9PMV6_9PEZI|nr:hypothetical protein LTR77_000381 [Saxophila tyrrhenica]
MALLTDLPVEILELILEEVGGRNLRRNVDNLLLCRRWYDVAISVFHSGLEISSIRIHGCDVERLKDQQKSYKQRLLMHKNAREVNVRLLGYWWDDKTKQVFERPVWPQTLRWQDQIDLPDLLNEPPEAVINNRRHPLSEWHRTSLAPAIEKLSEDLRRCETLDSLSFEALIDWDDPWSPKYPFLSSSLAGRLIGSLPVAQRLKRLTLDLASGLDYDETDCAHVCEDVARILHLVECVRLRLALICPCIFELPKTVEKEDIRLKSLVLKLNQPYPNVTRNRISRACTPVVEWPGFGGGLHDGVTSAARGYIRALCEAHTAGGHGEAEQWNGSPQHIRSKGLEMFRISNAPAHASRLVVLDCIEMRYLHLGADAHPDEDRGWPHWFEEEEITSETLSYGYP